MSSERIKAKIAALLAKTEANGCTEAEALAAAEAAARLMRDHGLSEAELVMGEATADEFEPAEQWRITLVGTIAYVTNCSWVRVQKRHGWEILFIGRAPGPEIAMYLRTVCIRAVWRETAFFKHTPTFMRHRLALTRVRAVSEFREALVDRLSIRMRELFRSERRDDHRQEADRALATRFPDLTVVRGKARPVLFSGAAEAGWEAGGRVALNRGVSSAGGAPPRRLPHRS